MNLMKVSWKNLLHKPWSTSLSVLLAALGAGLISLILLINHQLEQQFERNLAGVDLVVGAKGSPLQLILSSMYHIDAPTGNIPISECKAFLNPRHPLIESAIPLSLGDSYRMYRIVGTTHSFLDMYEAKLQDGRLWDAPLEVVAGAVAAEKLGLKIGDSFQSSHGFVLDDNLVHDHADASFKVVGLLAPSGSVADQLLLTSNASLWVVHEHGTTPSFVEEEKEEEEHDHDHSHDEADDHAHHDHAAHEGHDHDEQAVASPYDQPLFTYEDKSITAILTQFKGRNIQSLNMQRNINENTNLQAATPAIEINRLYSTMGSAERILRALAWVIVIVSVLSIFISLFSNLDERRYELSLMRVMGASRARLFVLILIEGAMLAFVGCLIGLFISHAGMAVISGWLEEAYRYNFSAWEFLPLEGWLIVSSIALGLLAALIPAIRAGRVDIHDTLSEG